MQGDQLRFYGSSKLYKEWLPADPLQEMSWVRTPIMSLTLADYEHTNDNRIRALLQRCAAPPGALLSLPWFSRRGWIYSPDMLRRAMRFITACADWRCAKYGATEAAAADRWDVPRVSIGAPAVHCG